MTSTWLDESRRFEKLHGGGADIITLLSCPNLKMEMTRKTLARVQFLVRLPLKW
jgi:hypothetical protein